MSAEWAGTATSIDSLSGPVNQQGPVNWLAVCASPALTRQRCQAGEDIWLRD